MKHVPGTDTGIILWVGVRMKGFNFFSFLCLFFVIVFASTQTVFALSPEQKSLFNKNILFYDLACNSVNTNTSASDDASSGGSIFVIGDSLSVGMRNNGGLGQELRAQGWEVTGIETTSGISLSSSLSKIDANRQAIQSADTVLVELGSNGAESGAIEQMINKIKSIKASSPSPDVQILWQNIYSTQTLRYPTFPAFNQNLNAKQSQGKISKILDWEKEATENPSKYNLSRDSLGIHPQTSDGYKKMAEWLVSQVGRSGSGSGSSTTSSGPSGGTGSASIDKVFVVGDSVTKVADTAVSIPNLKQRFADKGIESIIEWSGGAATNGYGGEFGTNGVKMLENNRSEIAGVDAVIVAMGTNDEPGAIASGIEEMVQKIKSYNNSADIFWVNTHTQASGNSAWTAAGSRQKNTVIQQKANNLGYTVIDVTDAGFDFASDNIHPAYDAENGIGKWMDAVVASVSEGSDTESETSVDACECPSDGSTSLTGRDNAEKVWNFFIDKGLPDIPTAAIMGNMYEESGYDPKIVQNGGSSENPSDAGDGGYGIIQWTPGSKLTDSLNAAGIDGPPYELATQLELVWGHMQNDPPITTGAFSVEDYKKINDIEQATRYFHDNIEGSADDEAGIQERVTSAQRERDQFGGSGGGGSSSSSGCGGSSTAPADCKQLQGTPKEIIDNVALPIASDLGFDSTPESVEAANAAHGPTVTGSRSDHQGPPDEAWAADISNGQSPTPEMDKLAQSLAECFGLPPEHWEGNLNDGRDNQCNSNVSKNGYRIQLIYRTSCGGNHYNHVHIGVGKE